MKNKHMAWLCIAALGLATLACDLSGLATPTEDLGTRVAVALTGTSLAETEAAVVSPYPLPLPSDTPAPPVATAEATTAVPPTAAPGTTVAPGTTALIGGKLCYPADLQPPLTIYAREVNTQATVSVDAVQNQGQYQIEVAAPGTYIVFAYNDQYNVGGTYSAAIACGLTVNCTDHAPIQIPVQPGNSVTNADICDYYGPPGFIPANPHAGTATIMGNLCYPSEGIPPLTVYARDVNTNQTFTIQTAQNQNQYSIDVPAPATYILFAYVQGNGIGGSYSQAVPCGLTADCNDHTPIPVPVTAGSTASDANICDFYGPEGSVPSP